MSRIVYEAFAAETIDPASIPSAEAFGTPTQAFLLDPSSIPSAEAFGTPSLQSFIDPASIASAESFGTPSLNLSLDPASIASSESFGTPVQVFLVDPGSIASEEAFGIPEFIVGVNVVIEPDSIPSEEAFGGLVFTVITPCGVSIAESCTGRPVILECMPVPGRQRELVTGPHSGDNRQPVSSVAGRSRAPVKCFDTPG